MIRKIFNEVFRYYSFLMLFIGILFLLDIINNDLDNGKFIRMGIFIVILIILYFIKQYLKEKPSSPVMSDAKEHKEQK